MRKHFLQWATFLVLACLLAVGLYFLPPIHQRLSWRLEALRAQVFYFLHPPDQTTFASVQNQVNARATLQSLAARLTTIPSTAKSTNTPQSSPAPAGSAMAGTPTLVMTATPIPTAIPAKTTLSGIRYQWQSFNNCGPANLAIALSFWGWKGDQRLTKSALRPNDDDANVMPEEMVSFVDTQTELKALVRVGGSLERIKELVAAGFPVLTEMGHQPKKDWWMGHYVVVSGYDDSTGHLVTQDSLIMPDLPVPYTEIRQNWWRDFNHLYIVIYPVERDAKVQSILGTDWDVQANYRRALVETEREIPQLSGRDLFFALYNRGDDLLALGDAAGASSAYDLAFAQYTTLQEKDRPWRVTWYRTGPYQAYYLTGRYQDVIDLSNSTLSMLSKRGLEESHYWRGLAYEALGERDKAIFDYQIAVRLRPSYQLALDALARLGADKDASS